jgi:hypothetical protein
MSQNTSTGAAPTPLPSGSAQLNILFLKINEKFQLFFIPPALLNGFVSHKKSTCELQDHSVGIKKEMFLKNLILQT